MRKSIKAEPTCRFCGKGLRSVFADFKISPISNDYLGADDLPNAEFLSPAGSGARGLLPVQTPRAVRRERIFNEHYAYFSSYSKSWLNHANRYVEAMIERFGYTLGKVRSRG